MWELDNKEGWEPKNWCFQTVVLEKILASPFNSKEIKNQSILKEINPEHSLERLKLKLQYFSGLMQRANSLEKTLMLGKNEGKRRRGQQKMRQMHHQLNGHEFEQTLVGSEDWEAWWAAVHEVTNSRTQHSDWTTTKRSQSLRRATPEWRRCGLTLKLKKKFQKVQTTACTTTKTQSFF